MRNYIPLLKHPNVKAFLALIRYTEGADYDTLFGGEVFTDFSDHPRRKITRKLGGKPITSSAAGAYQFLSRTWDECAKALWLADFFPASQDQAALFLIDRRKALVDVLQGNWPAAIEKCNREWASLPGSPYGQPTKSMQKCLAFLSEQMPVITIADPVVQSPVLAAASIVDQSHEPPKTIVTNVLDAYTIGKEIYNAAKWKKWQVVGSRLAVFLTAVVGVARAYGYDFGLTDAQLLSIGTAVGGLLGVFNEVATTVSTARIGVRPRGDVLPELRTDGNRNANDVRGNDSGHWTSSHYSGDDSSLPDMRGRG
jgi:muramidase (phage lysozyme)